MTATRILITRFAEELHLCCKGIARRDDTFGETCGTGSVVDRSNFAVITFVVNDIVLGEAVGILFLEEILNILPRELLVRTRQELEVLERINRLNLLELVQIHAVPDEVRHEQQFGARVIDDMLRIIGLEIVQNRHNNTSVSHGCKVHNNPVTAVFAHYGNLVVLTNLVLSEQQVQTSNLCR